VYRTRPTIPTDLRRTVEEQRRTINELRQQVAELTRRIAGAEPDSDSRRALTRELQALHQQLISYADDLKALYRTVRQQGRHLRKGTHDVIRVLMNAIEARDAASAKHARYVAAIAAAIGQRLALDEETSAALHVAALLHDLGNVLLDREVAATSGPLSREQWAKEREHPVIGAMLMADITTLAAAAPIVRQHHERWDGKGYPDGIAGEAILLAARILAVAEAFASMLATRPHRPGLTIEQARQQILAGAGSQFDPRCVDAFVAALAADEIPSYEADIAAS
jgi:HD-GYP domain-containing protein (c-di-GMP phosphodiesterase class II)